MRRGLTERNRERQLSKKSFRDSGRQFVSRHFNTGERERLGDIQLVGREWPDGEMLFEVVLREQHPPAEPFLACVIIWVAWW